MDASALERDAVQFARLAVQRDHEGRYSEAVFYYKVRTGTGLGPRHPIKCWRNPRRRGGVLLGSAESSLSGRRCPPLCCLWLPEVGWGVSGLFAVCWP